ncbi:hypothetical protein [Companilactobacillus ginsenosidimutans]|uniref:Uncharacterized protein n=1 Tax=Companilactobacillus ginsenosidimutans TaxID=1007676 RepID=A0A0H4QHP6_9LACO|nr:hypothetical protein [Companilactobacillus ginsenosidimutans]AKP67472.1 hypothetical protein ABM34_07975 [Companilactobacillus ginsenosidimutans]
MNNSILVLTIVSIFLLLIFTGFLIVLVVGLVIDKSLLKSVGKVGMMICIPFLILSFVGTGTVKTLHETKIKHEREMKNKKEKKELEENNNMDSIFSATIDDFMKEALKVKEDAPEVASKEAREWKDAIHSNPSGFEISDTITNITLNNMEKLNDLSVSLKSMKESLDVMSDNDTGYYDYDAYEDVYKKSKKMYDFIFWPEVSLLEFAREFNKLKDDVDDSFDNLAD